MKKYAMMILGCKVNDYEATYVRERMNEHFEEVSFKEEADIYLIFTCCVTNTAESKTRKFIHDARRRNPNAYIAAIGCLSQIKPEHEVFQDVDLLIGSENKDRIVDLILEDERVSLVNREIHPKFEDLFIHSYPTKSRAFLKVQDGCNQFCSYCVIPYARGRERSGDHQRLIEEARELALNHKEIVLTGIHTGRYNDGTYDLYHLLKDLVTIEGLETIRLSSIEITEISDEIIELMKKNKKLAHHLHIPVQSMDDTILKAMHRPYTVKEYLDRIAYIRCQIPDISISTDLIVGFPGEDDEMFRNTMENLSKAEFSFIHIFPYSRKSGTAADAMKGHIDPKIKKERVSQVTELDRQLRKKYRDRFLNKDVEVLIERVDENDSFGYSREYIYVRVKGEWPIGSLQKVRIDRCETEVIGHVAEQTV